MKNLLVNIGALLLLFTVYVLLFSFMDSLSINGFFGIENPKIAIPIQFMVISIFTFCGIYSQVIFDEIRATKSEKVNLQKLFSNPVRKKSFWISLLISPIILFFVFNGISQFPDSFMSILFAYQNGFFFKSVISGLDA